MAGPVFLHPVRAARMRAGLTEDDFAARMTPHLPDTATKGVYVKHVELCHRRPSWEWAKAAAAVCAEIALPGEEPVSAATIMDFRRPEVADAPPDEPPAEEQAS